MPPIKPLPEQEIFPALEQKALLLTVNRRLARSFLERYHEYQRKRGCPAWETPEVLPWEGWIRRCLERAVFRQQQTVHPVPLSHDQELFLWEEIIGSAEQSRGLLNLEETARQAGRAWLLTRHWRLEKTLNGYPWLSPEQEAFMEWSREFRQRLQSLGRLEQAGQPEYVAWLLANNIISVPETVILAGFERLSPIQEHVLDILIRRGCRIFSLEFQKKISSVHAVSLADQSREIRAAALWARHRLMQDAWSSVAIIVPDLSSMRLEIVHTLEAVLHPEAQTSPEPLVERIFDLSLGLPLSEYPMVRGALHILDLARDPIPLPVLSALLASPFVRGSETELAARGLLETDLRKRREPEVSWRHLLSAAGEDQPGRSCPVLSRSLRAFVARWQELPQAQSPGNWAGSMELLLRDMGWPGEKRPGSHEYQTLQAWNEALQRLAGLDQITGEMSLKQVLQQLRSILAGTIFQPEGPRAGVRVMGMLEAVGERFDHMWIMGLTDQAWPLAPDPNPFLPLALQRKLDMPRSSPELELDYARQVTERLRSGASEVIMSWPRREEDRELLPSPLIRDIPLVREEALGLAADPDPWLKRLPGENLESFEDEQGPFLAIPCRAPGGTGLLKSQAACPFQAFARHRLGAQSPEEPVFGLGPLERGIIMHSALEHFWRDCRNQASLLSFSREKLQQLVAGVVDEALREMHLKRPLTMTREFMDLERERLHDLLLEWLDLEAERPPFVVHALEKRFEINIAGLHLNVMADRLDRLENGRLVVIDYKSGLQVMSEWFQERPLEPQVPLYSLFTPEPVTGVYFGVVRKGECAFVGLGQEGGMVPGCPGFADYRLTRDHVSWEDLLAFWRMGLEKLAAEVVRGEARVDPGSPKACRQCDLHSLCRVFELT